MQILSRSMSEVPVPFYLAKSIPSFGLNEDATNDEGQQF